MTETSISTNITGFDRFVDKLDVKKRQLNNAPKKKVQDKKPAQAVKK